MKKQLNRLISINLNPFELDVEQQKKLLEKYSEPEDLFQRSYYQYKIQVEVIPYSKLLINNIIGLFALFYFFIKGAFMRVNKIKNSNSNLAIFPYKNYHYPNIIPSELIDEFDIMKINFMEGYLFAKKDVKLYFYLLKKYHFQFYFLSKCISKILFFRFIVDKYNPKAIISIAEYSFSSSISTHFCRENGVEHINIMHGEKFFIIKDTFFEFDRFYIWDEFYKKLFIKLKAAKNQFIVGDFLNLKMNINSDKIKYNYTYYLAAEKKEQLILIKEALLKIDSPSNICIRYHPRYSNVEEVIEVFNNGFEIENSKDINMEESFSSTKNVISLYSSCLLQAYYNNKNIIIDDVSNSQEKLKILKDSEYIILSKPHKKLSELVL